MSYSLSKRSGFTLIELLIVSGIVSLLMFVTLIIANPPELLRQSRDGARLAELNQLEKIIMLSELDPRINLSENYAVYVSIPDPSVPSGGRGVCNPGLGLPALVTPWQYKCVNPQDLQKVDGNGWLPLDLSLAPANQLAFFPIDPINIADNGLYYAFTNKSGKYVVVGSLESEKYLKKNALPDGIDPIRVEMGNDFNLWGEASGLLGFWPFD